MHVNLCVSKHAMCESVCKCACECVCCVCEYARECVSVCMSVCVSECVPMYMRYMCVCLLVHTHTHLRICQELTDMFAEASKISRWLSINCRAREAMLQFQRGLWLISSSKARWAFRGPRGKSHSPKVRASRACCPGLNSGESLLILRSAGGGSFPLFSTQAFSGPSHTEGRPSPHSFLT